MQTEENKLLVELYEKYNKLVYSLAFNILKNQDTSEECVQETFLIVAQKIDRFKSLEESHQRNLICTIAKGKAIDSVRKEKTVVIAENIEDISISSFDDFEEVELLEMLEKLDEKEQTYIFLKYVYGFSNVEIGKMYSVSASYVGRVINQSLKQIKMNLEGKNE